MMEVNLTAFAASLATEFCGVVFDAGKLFFRTAEGRDITASR